MRGVELAQGAGGPPVTFPTVDLTKLIPDLVNPLLTKLAQVISSALNGLWTSITGSGFNVLTRTAPEWSVAQPAVVDLANNAVVAINGITALAVVMTGIGLIGREFWGWSWGPVDSAVRIAMGVVLGTGAMRLCVWSVNLVDQVNEGIGGAALTAPPFQVQEGGPLSLLMSALLSIPWFIVGLLLWVLMAERLGVLVLLFVIGPIALGLWSIPETRWITVTWARMWVGWLVGQPLALICLKLATVFAGLGADAGVAALFGIAMLLLARKAAVLFVPGGSLGWSGTVSRVATAVALRR